MKTKSFLLVILLSACVSAQAPLIVTYPAGGETFHVGDTVLIQWQANSSSIVLCGFEVSLDGGKSYTPLPGSSNRGDSNWCKFSWIIPDSIDSGMPSVSSQCRIEVYSYTEESMKGFSDSNFVILPRDTTGVVMPLRSPRNNTAAGSGATVPRNEGCGTGFGIALLPPIITRSFRRKRKSSRP